MIFIPLAAFAIGEVLYARLTHKTMIQPVKMNGVDAAELQRHPYNSKLGACRTKDNQNRKQYTS